MLSIGIVPAFFINVLNEPVKLFLNLSNTKYALPNTQYAIQPLSYIGWSSLAFILLAALIFFVRKFVMNIYDQQKTINVQPTWGCGYVAPNVKMQYTATSYIRTYRQLAEPLLLIFKKKKEIEGIFPIDGGHETHPYDKIEKWLIDKPLIQMRHFFNRFVFSPEWKVAVLYYLRCGFYNSYTNYTCYL